MIKTTTILFALLFLYLVLPINHSVYAQCSVIRFPGGESISGHGFAGPLAVCVNTPAAILSIFLPAIFGIAGFITVIVIVISGIQFILSSGNPEGAAAARGRLIYALVGFALIVLAFAILQIVNRLFLGTTVA